jgi:gluconokinase
MAHRILLMGVSGSGKSTIGPLLGQALGVAFADADAFHPPANIEKMSRGEALNDADRAPWLDAIGAWLGAHAGGIAGCSALKRAYRDRLRALAPGLRILYLFGDAAMIATRQSARSDHFMPASLMASQFATLEPPGADERAIILDTGAPPAAVVAQALAALRGPDAS